MHRNVRLLLCGQCLDHHARSEVGTTDADIDDIGDALAGKAAPLATVNLLAKSPHPGEHGPDFRRRILAGAQIHVPHRTTFSVVDGFAVGHFLLPAVDVGGVGQAAQQVHGFCRDPLL